MQMLEYLYQSGNSGLRLVLKHLHQVSDDVQNWSDSCFNQHWLLKLQY